MPQSSPVHAGGPREIADSSYLLFLIMEAEIEMIITGKIGNGQK